ncbi:AAA family ATPase [Vibrio vulnificus]|uniref:AAA family ATPase n=1 Tax=Vibrio vulnificus TaxID=672 RepID=UPI001A910AC0|nr:AAA family ATPase [Vibrio vulnificus]
MDRIVKSIEVKNYKAFKEGTLHLDPFSLLIGTNSSGKSSLLKLVLMLAQSNTVTKDNFIIPYGSLIDLGENKNIKTQYQ